MLRYRIVLYADLGRFHHRAATLEDAKGIVHRVKHLIDTAEIFYEDELVYCWGVLPPCS
jgi:hypothetical protein